jgi:hypothetical protein
MAGAIASLLILASMHPGVKGPHITDHQAIGALIAGAALGVAAVVVARRLTSRSASSL